MTTPRPRGRPGVAWPQVAALVVGAAYLAFGIAGFFVTGSDEEFIPDDTGEMLLVFEINNVHNLVHLLIGLAGLTLAGSLSAARTFGWLLALGYGGTFVYGLFAVDEAWDVLNLNRAALWLHLGSALLGLLIARGPVRSGAQEPDTRT